MNKFIVIKTTYQGIHRYKDAPDQVSYLRNEHRHLFYVQAKIQIFDDDRELEFIIVKDFIDKYFRDRFDNYHTYHMGDQSCEMVATDLLNQIKNEYGNNRKISVSIFEDNENGAVVEDF